MSLIQWLAFRNGLKTRNLLAARISIQDPSCAFYNSGIQDVWHLLLDYNFSSEIWLSLASKFGGQVSKCDSLNGQLSQLLSIYDQTKEGDVTLAKLCFQAFIACLWYESNLKIFSNSKSSVREVRSKIAISVRARAFFLGINPSPTLAAAWDLSSSNCNRRS